MQAAGDAAASAEYQALLAAQEAERQAALQEMHARSAQRAENVGKQVFYTISRFSVLTERHRLASASPQQLHRSAGRHRMHVEENCSY